MRDEFTLGAISCQNLVREIYDFLNRHLKKVTILRMLEQRSMIRFFLKHGLAAKEIPRCLSRVYSADAMKKTQMFHWVQEISAGCEAFSDNARADRPCQINLGIVWAHKLKLNPPTTAKNLALSLDVSVQTVVNHLHHILGMKCYH
jgi:hypothetical protein